MFNYRVIHSNMWIKICDKQIATEIFVAKKFCTCGGCLLPWSLCWKALVQKTSCHIILRKNIYLDVLNPGLTEIVRLSCLLEYFYKFVVLKLLKFFVQRGERNIFEQSVFGMSSVTCCCKIDKRKRAATSWFGLCRTIERVP